MSYRDTESSFLDKTFWLNRLSQLKNAPKGNLPKYKIRDDSTTNRIHAMGNNWKSWSLFMFEDQDPNHVLRNANVSDFVCFFEWYLSQSKITRHSTLETQWKYLRIHYICVAD